MSFKELTFQEFPCPVGKNPYGARSQCVPRKFRIKNLDKHHRPFTDVTVVEIP